MYRYTKDSKGFTVAEVGFSVADLRTNEVKRVRIANRLSKLSLKAQMRNSVSVEQIQDGCSDSETRNFRSSVAGGKISDRNLKPVQEQNSRIIRFNRAFTLAEVLITLGVIGVVAAITLQGLINSYNKKITETRLKKFYSMFNQAIKLSTVENGEAEGWNEYWAAADYGKNGLEPFEKYLLPYMSIAYKKSTVSNVLYVLSDGSAFALNKSNTRDIAFYPKNAEKCMARTKRKGICEFYFIFYPIGNAQTWKYHYGKGLEVYLFNWNGNNKRLYTDISFGCNTRGEYCTAIIKNNGWKIPSDYPHKIQY